MQPQGLCHLKPKQDYTSNFLYKIDSLRCIKEDVFCVCVVYRYGV